MYGALVADLAVFVPYFVLIHTRHATLDFVVGALTILIAAQIVLQGAIALFSRNRLKDERDQLILLRGYRAGYVTLLGVMLALMTLLWLGGGPVKQHADHFGVHFLSMFVLVLMLAELVKTITQVATYRRSM